MTEDSNGKYCIDCSIIQDTKCGGFSEKCPTYTVYNAEQCLECSTVTEWTDSKCKACNPNLPNASLDKKSCFCSCC